MNVKNILVVEDSKTINNIISNELKNNGFEISQAYNYKEAKTLIQTKEFDLIVLDLHLPDGEGSVLIANIQSLTKTKVVVLTAMQDEDLREELFSYGIIDYIVKDANLIYSIKEIIKIISHLNEAKKEKILVIDDSSFITKQIKIMLEPREYYVDVALSASEGLRKLQSGDYSLLILDMELPDIHGLELLKSIRKQKQFLDLAIIVLSGHYDAEVVRKALKNGSNDFLKKPFVFEEFVLKVDLWIDYFKKEKALKELNKTLEEKVQQKVEELRQKDMMLLQQSRHAQMGEMIAMIAHQWRQPLNIISASTTLLEQKVRLKNFEPQQLQNIAKKIKLHLEYLSTTIDDFRNFFQPKSDKVETDFEKIITKAIELSNIKEKNIALEITIKEKVTFFTFETELIQVVLNLLKNALDVLEEREVQKGKISIVIDGNKLEILDNGGGIPSEILPKIFEPYFTTKYEKNGTGLGLYMSRLIVNEHCQGVLDVENKQEGACFSITLPMENSVCYL